MNSVKPASRSFKYLKGHLHTIKFFCKKTQNCFFWNEKLIGWVTVDTSGSLSTVLLILNVGLDSYQITDF